MAEDLNESKYNSGYYRKKLKEALEKLIRPSTIRGIGEKMGENLKLLEKVEFKSSGVAVCYITENLKTHMIPAYSFLRNII